MPASLVTPSVELIEWAIEKKLPWLRWDAARGELEFVIDNYLLSMYRACPAYFMLSAVEGWRRKSISGDVTREWALDFGILFHKMMEIYYHHFKEPTFDLPDFAIKTACEQWYKMEMDVHLSHKECQQMGGYPGFAGMLIQYATQYKAENERIRVLATEVSFGKNREVPIYEGLEFNVYLAGRMDIIADDGFFIFPLDHKTKGSFGKGDPMDAFLIDDGPTGYIYAMNHVLPSIVPEELILKRSCNQIQMNLISKAVPKEGSRFKRFTLRKSDEQLQDYRLRVTQTCKHLLADLETYIRGEGTPRDTSKCTNWYFKNCPFHDVHRQLSKDAEQATLKNGFLQFPIWDTEAVAPVEEPQ